MCPCCPAQSRAAREGQTGRQRAAESKRGATHGNVCNLSDLRQMDRRGEHIQDTGRRLYACVYGLRGRLDPGRDPGADRGHGGQIPGSRIPGSFQQKERGQGMSTQQSKDIAALVESYINASQEGRRLLVERSEEIAFLYPARGRKRPKMRGGCKV